MKNLKIGDKVILKDSYNQESVPVIGGETKLCWRVGSYLYYKEDGRERNGSIWRWGIISKWTQEEENRIKNEKIDRKRRKEFLDKIDHTRFRDLTTDQLAKIARITK